MSKLTRLDWFRLKAKPIKTFETTALLNGWTNKFDQPPAMLEAQQLRYMKKIKYWVIVALSFAFGAYMLWITFSILSSNTTLVEGSRKTGEALPGNFRDLNFRALVCSILGGIGGFANGIWYLLNIKNPDVLDW